MKTSAIGAAAGDAADQRSKRQPRQICLEVERRQDNHAILGRKQAQQIHHLLAIQVEGENAG